MLKVQNEVREAPGIGERILRFFNDGLLSPYIAVQNIGADNTASIHYEESADGGATWSQISGTSKVIDPGQADGQIVTSVKRDLAVYATGNTNLLITVSKLYSASQNIY